MNKRSGIKNALLLAVLVLGASPAIAAGSAQSVQVKLGYFNLAAVKAAYPEAQVAENLKDRATAILTQEVEKGNAQLQKLQSDGKSKDEVEKARAQLQIEVSAKQSGLFNLVNNSTYNANVNISQAVSQVAKDKGLDVVFDANGIFSGGEKVATSGEDITADVLKKLTPQTQQTQTASPPAARANGQH